MTKIISIIFLSLAVLFTLSACKDVGDPDADTKDTLTDSSNNMIFDEEHMPNEMYFESFEALAEFCYVAENADEDEALEYVINTDYVFYITKTVFNEWFLYLEEKNIPIVYITNNKYELLDICVTLDDTCIKTQKIELRYANKNDSKSVLTIMVRLTDDQTCDSYDAIETVGGIEVKCVYDDAGDYLRVYADTANVFVKKSSETIDIKNSLKLVLFNELMDELNAETSEQ